MKYEVTVNGVLVYMSEVEVDVSVVVDGAEVYHLTGVPQLQDPETAGLAEVVTGYQTTATGYNESRDKDVTLIDRQEDITTEETPA